MAKRSKKRCEHLPILHPHAAGIDVGASELFVAVSADRDPSRVRAIGECARSLYYFPDQQGLEVDFLVPGPHAGLCLVEAKATKTVRPAMAFPLFSLRRSLPKRLARLVVVHRKSGSELTSAALAPGVEALDVERFVADLNRAN